jgi:glycosyltransferase involved in cell wall biosynthesis
MKTITIDARHLYSGIGTYIYGLLDNFHISNTPFRFRLIGPENLLSSRYPRFDIIPCKIPIYTIAEQIRIPGYARDTDLLHVPHFNIPVFYHGKLVTTVHDVAHFAIPELVNNPVKKWYRDVIFKNLIRQSNQIITVSQFSATELMYYTACPQEKIHVITNGVLSEFLKIGSKITKNPVSDSRPYVLYVGNAKPHKNLKRQITAFRQFKTETGLPHKFVLVGQEPFDGISQLNFMPDIVVVPGCTTEELISIYRDADILLQLSFYEGFGLTTLEAMTCDTPVLVSDIPAIREVVGEAGLYANPTDIRDISRKMAKLALDSVLRRSLIRRGWQCVGRFSWSLAGEQTLDVYEAVLHNRIYAIQLPA